MEAEEGLRLGRSVTELRETFRSGRTRGVAWRKSQLRAILKLIDDHEDAIFEALHQDLGKHPVEVYRDEIGVVKKSATNSLSCVEKWMAPKKQDKYGGGEVGGEFTHSTQVMTLALDPLMGAISAGNTVVVKPSELAPACSSFLANTLPLYLDSKAVKVIEGGADISQQLLQQKWDKIFFTGSARVGRIVMSEAAKHLTPVTLELGGKCPIILDTLSDPSDIKVAAKRIAGGKWGPCSGQACIAIDYLLVEQKFASTMIEFLKKTISRFYGENPKNLKNLSRIVNKHQFERLRNILEDPSIAVSIIHGGSLDEKNLTIEPTILLNPPLDADIMTEEIFGPLLPIITLTNIQESIEFINSRPKPLAIYAFTKNDSFKKKILAETSSGSVAFNDTMIQFVCDTLPFGGVGQSGFGRYHGKYSFDTFSHEKAVLHRSFFLDLEPRYPPWNDFKMQFIRFAYMFDYLRIVLLLLGYKLKKIFSPGHLA
ncbi:aldehyde dehydrogenase 3F1 [Actinidia rufa]|uniref:Aldehyde dehydrogenase n=1 Tax=Actinidia rufa TaxID=165716 RepID=A0A7J0E318_9ERIC|nr:aldehyde dehydrogenase 3F1 [Actinidia rufa]